MYLKMNTSPRSNYVYMLNLSIAWSFFFLFLTTTTTTNCLQNPNPDDDLISRPKPIISNSTSSSSPKSAPKSPSESSSSTPKPHLVSSSSPKPAHSGASSSTTKPASGSHTRSSSSPKSAHGSHAGSSSSPKPAPKPPSGSSSSSPKPAPKSHSGSLSNPKPTPKSNSTSPSNPKPKATPKSNDTTSSTETKPNATSPYHFVNHFCLSRRLDVRSTFCLQVLRSNPTSLKAKDNKALLDIAADFAIKFGQKTLILLKKTSADKKAEPGLKAVIEECVPAYEGYLTQYNTLVEEARTDLQLASYDSELAKLELNRCVRVLKKTRNADIETQNKIALDYARLTQNIADSIE